MSKDFVEILSVGGKANSLGRAGEVVEIVLQDRSRLDELYACLSSNDAWVRMRAIDSLEKVCRVHPDWLLPYVDRLADEYAGSSQPSVLWHMAQIYGQVDLTDVQKTAAIDWLRRLLSDKNVDWIVAANGMDTLMQFTRDGSFPRDGMIRLLRVQQGHKSKAVVRRADKFMGELTGK